MRPLVRRLKIVAGCLLAAALVRAEDAAVPKTSPFTPPAVGPAASRASTENYELAAISTIGTKTTVNIFDKAAKKGRWIAVGEAANGIKVLAFDAAREQVVVRVGNGPEKVLALRRASGPTVGPVTAAHAAPNPVAPAAINVDRTAGASASEPANHAVPPAPGTVAYQEQEARMLVSDLLEIGMAQRQAYEEAQRKAAESAQKATPPPPPAKKSSAKP